MSNPDPVLLLHGQPGSANDWDLVVANVDRRTPTLAIDRPGYDRLTPPGGIAHSAEAALARLNAEGIERTTIAGASFGGAVAAWLAACHPERVGALVLISPAANADALVPADRLLAAPVLGPAASAGLLLGAGALSAVHPVRQRLARAWGVSEPYLRRTSAQLLNQETLRTFVVEQRALLDELPVLDGMLGRIQAPTTIVIGSRDPIVPPSANRRLATQIDGAELVEIEGARHSLTVTHSGAIAELIVRASTETVERRSCAPSQERQGSREEGCGTRA